MFVKRTKILACFLLVITGLLFFNVFSAKAANLYWFSDGSDTQWTTLTNWWTDADHAIGHEAAGLPTGADAVVTVGTVGPNVDIDTWTPPASINATATGINFTSATNSSLGMNITGDAFFYGDSVNDKTVTGNATFYDSSCNYSSHTVTENATFYDSSCNNGTVGGDAFFYDLSQNLDTISGNACFASTATDSNPGGIGGSITVCPILPPTVTTGSSFSLNASTSALFGTITHTGGENPTVGVEYSIDNSYGSTKSNSGTFGTGAFSVVVPSLTCGTTYNYHVFATNSAGTSYGSNSTFTTGACGGPTATLYGIDGADGNPDAPHLFTLNPATGSKILDKGAVGYNITGLAFSPLSGILYGDSGESGSNQKSLFTINTSTGVGTYLGTILNGVGDSLVMTDISFRSDGRLYGWGGNDLDPFNADLYTIDLTSCDGVSDFTCLATKVGDSGFSLNDNGLAFDSADNLFLFGNTDNSYYKINPDTGMSVTEFTFANPSGNNYSLGAAAFNENDVVFAPRLNGGGTPSDLIAVNQGTDTIISMGDNSNIQYISAIAFRISSGAIVVPTLTTSFATSLTRNSAILNGSITNTGGADASLRGFNYGTTIAYGSTVTESSGPYGNGAFSSDLTSLSCGTTYHYRSYAINSAGTNYGNDATFITSDCPSSSGGSSSRIIVPAFVPTITPPPASPPLPSIPPPGSKNPPSNSPTLKLTTPPPAPGQNFPPEKTESDNQKNNNTSNPSSNNTESTPPATSPSFTDRIINGANFVVTSVRDITNNFVLKIIEIIAIIIPATSSLFSLLSSSFSGMPLSNYLVYLSIIGLQFLGFAKSSKPWGTVYDSFTKRPLPYARVEALNEQSRKLQSTIADGNGRYGFLVSEHFGNMQFQAYLSKYIFPSKIEPSVVEQKLYPNIYRGGLVNASGGLANFDLPMDPIGKSFAHNFYFGITSVKLNNMLTKSVDVLFVLGVILGIINSVTNPSMLNLAVLVAILLTFILRTSGFKLKSFGLTKDVETSQVLPFGLVALHDNQNGKRINFTVSDDRGRYFLLTPKGNYLLKAYTPSHISPVRTKEIPIFTDKGWISREIEI